MTIPVIKSLGHLPLASFLGRNKNSPLNNSEAIMTADNSTTIWSTTKQVIQHFAALPR